MNKLKEIVFKLKSSLTNTYAINDLEHKVKQHVSFELMRQKMIDSVLTNREKGIIEESADGERYVVSLTTHGERIEKVFQAIESVFLQSRKANKGIPNNCAQSQLPNDSEHTAPTTTHIIETKAAASRLPSRNSSDKNDVLTS